MTDSTHFIYSYMASDIWYRTTQIAREKTHLCHMGYSFRLAARLCLYASSHRQDSTYHCLCYTSRGAMAGTRNSPMGPSTMKDWSDDPSHRERTLLPRSYISLPTPWRIDPTTHRTVSERSYRGATSRSHQASVYPHL